MALLWVDSFDHYATADIGEKYTVYQYGDTVAAVGRRGTAAYRARFDHWITTTVPPADTKVITGVAVKTSGASVVVLAVLAGVTTQLQLRISAGTIQVLRGTSTVIASSAAGIFPIGQYSYIELKAVIHPSAGSVQVRVNEATVIPLTSSLNTANSGTATWSGVQLGPANPENLYDDFYVCDGSGPAPQNDFLGDCRVDARYPTAEGVSSAWSPSAGADNALMIDETAPDDDTTYVTTAIIGATDTHVVQDVTVAGAVLYGVQVVTSQKKSDAGTCAIAPVVRHAGTDRVGTPVAPGTTYRYAVATYGTIPGTAGPDPWTETDFNNAEFGYQRTA